MTTFPPDETAPKMAPNPTGLVDVHAHFVTERYVAAATAAGHEHPDAMPGWPQWNTAAHLDLMDSGRIQTSILSVSSPGTHFGDDRAGRTLSREVNECAARLRASHPTRFGHFASLPLPDIDGALHEIEYALETLNADGFAVETNHHGAYPGDNRYEPVWAELDRRRAVVFVHPTSPPNASAVSLGRPRPMLEFLFDSARAASDLVFTGTLLRHPGIQWIFSHGGGVLPLLVDRMELFRSALPSDDCDPAATASVADQLRMLWFDMAGTPFPRQIPALTDLVGAERILYGSDYCWTPREAVRAQLAGIDSAEATAAGTWRELTTRNAQRLLRLPMASPTADRGTRVMRGTS